jgi:hypothetical protein
MLSDIEKKEVLKDFPNIKLSYENIVYKKVYNSDIILAIPEGIKCFAWFTNIENKNVCLVMEIGMNKQITNVKITNTCFSNELSYGTILYGTRFYYKHNHFFTIEDIFCYKGQNIERENWGNKFTILNNLLKKELKQVSYNNSFLVFGLPLFSKDIMDITNKINNVSYKINTIQFRLYNRVNNYLIISYENYIKNNTGNNAGNNIGNNQAFVSKTKNTNSYQSKNEKYNIKNILKQEIVFKIKPDVQNDIYHLYCLNNKLNEVYYNNAHIPDYKTSVFMNNLFRNIKENTNLDALEESDDEEEFENENEHKFVYMEREHNIVCLYNYKFKKWYPVKLADVKSKIVLQKDLPNIEK